MDRLFEPGPDSRSSAKACALQAMSHVGLNPQSLVFSHQGLPLRVVVETGVPGRSKIIRDLRVRCDFQGLPWPAVS